MPPGTSQEWNLVNYLESLRLSKTCVISSRRTRWSKSLGTGWSRPKIKANLGEDLDWEVKVSRNTDKELTDLKTPNTIRRVLKRTSRFKNKIRKGLSRLLTKSGNSRQEPHLRGKGNKTCFEFRHDEFEWKVGHLQPLGNWRQRTIEGCHLEKNQRKSPLLIPRDAHVWAQKEK